MRGHIVRPFLIMFVGAVLRRDPGKIGFKVTAGGGSGIFLDHERGGRVPAKKGQETLANAALGDKIAHGVGEFVKSGTFRANRKQGVRLAEHGGQLTRQMDKCQRTRQGFSLAQKTKAPASRRALVTH